MKKESNRYSANIHQQGNGEEFMPDFTGEKSSEALHNLHLPWSSDDTRSASSSLLTGKEYRLDPEKKNDLPGRADPCSLTLPKNIDGNGNGNRNYSISFILRGESGW